MVMLWMLPVVKGFLASRISVFQTFDLTALVILLLVGLCLCKHKNIPRLKNHYVRWFLTFQFLLFFLMAISLVWTDAPDYGFQKTVKFGTFSLIAFVSPLVILDNRKQVMQFLYGLIFTACFVAMVVMFSPSFQTTSEGIVSNRTSAFESNPLNPAFFMAVSASVCFLIPRRLAFFSRLLFAVVFLVLQYAIFLTSSRSMFAQAFLALAIWALLTKSEWRWVFRVIVVLAVIGIPYFIISDAVLSNSRVGESLANPMASYDESGRKVMWDYCFQNWVYRPFLGHGIGSFAIDFFGQDKRNFPHNIFLESLYELGIPGFCLLSGMFIIVFRFFLKYKSAKGHQQREAGEKDLAVVWFSAVVAATLSISLHWDLADNRLLWNMLGCMFLIMLLPPERRAFNPPPNRGQRTAFRDPRVRHPNLPPGGWQRPQENT